MCHERTLLSQAPWGQAAQPTELWRTQSSGKAGICTQSSTIGARLYRPDPGDDLPDVIIGLEDLAERWHRPDDDFRTLANETLLLERVAGTEATCAKRDQPEQGVIVIPIDPNRIGKWRCHGATATPAVAAIAVVRQVDLVIFFGDACEVGIGTFQFPGLAFLQTLMRCAFCGPSAARSWGENELHRERYLAAGANNGVRPRGDSRGATGEGGWVDAGAPACCSYRLRAVILKVEIGLAKPFSCSSPTFSTSTRCSNSPKVFRLVRICPPCASSQSRAARLVTVPTAP
jgi:hypothetical protein